MVKKLGVIELVEALKDELRQLDENPESPHLFQINGAEIEVNVAVKTEAHGGVNFWVVQLGGKVSKEQIHKIKVKLSTLEQDNTKSVSNQYNQWEKQHNVSIVRPYTRKASPKKKTAPKKLHRKSIAKK